MTQEKNKKAVADLFCMEDARAVCEAIGGLGLNTDNQATDDPLEYTPDNILDVTVNENPDGMPALPQFTPKEMDSETQAFVVDELAKELQADGRESLNDEDLVPFMVKIKGENRISQDLTPFIDQITGNANNRLATQNVSEAQPNGVATDLTNGGNGAAPAAPAADPTAGMGELPPEAPGGLAAPTEAPALDANAGDSLNGDELWGNEPAAEGDFNLDVPEPGAEDASAGGDDTFNLDIGDEGGEAPAGDDTDTIGELDFGDEGGEGGEGASEGGDTPAEGGSSEDDLFSALDGMSDEALDDGSDLGGDEGDTGDVGDTGDTGDLGGEGGEGGSEDNKPTETECASAPVKTECGEAPADNTDIQLESIKANYVASLAKERVRAITEAYDRKRALAEKRALCESIISNYQENEAAKERKAVVESTMGEKISELGDKVAVLCENASKDKGLDAKLESILNNVKKGKTLDAKFESILSGSNKPSISSSSDVFDAKLESILDKVKASKALDAKLESIVNKVSADKAVDAKLAAIVESVKSPKAAPAKAPLDAKLESIIASTKQKIAAAK